MLNITQHNEANYRLIALRLFCIAHVLVCGFASAASVAANESESSASKHTQPIPESTVDDGPKVGDCVIYREGGEGRILVAPTYWLKGSIAKLTPERRMAQLCPQMGKSEANYTRADWSRMAAALPCVHQVADVREVSVLRVSVSVDEWETPWSSQHGSVRWLFRGHFLEQALSKGVVLDLDATLLERCIPRQ